MAAAGGNIDDDCPNLFQGNQMLGDTGLSGAHGIHDVAARCRAEGREEPQYLVSGPVAECGHSCLDIGRPSVVVRLRNPWHGSILTEHHEKSKKRTLDDT